MLERAMGIDPNSVIASTDFVQLLSMHASAVNVPTKITRSVDAAEAILYDIKMAEQEAQQGQQITEMAKAAKDLGQAPIGEGNALEAITEGLNG
jgi:hypothetical protein